VRDDELSDIASRTSPRGNEGTFARKCLNSAVAVINDVEEAGAAHHNACRIVELADSAAESSPGRHGHAERRELHDTMAIVGHVDEALPIESHVCRTKKIPPKDPECFRLERGSSPGSRGAPQRTSSRQRRRPRRRVVE